MSLQAKFMEHCRGLVADQSEKLPTYNEFRKSLNAADIEKFNAMLPTIEGKDFFTLLVDTDVDYFAQKYIDLATKAKADTKVEPVDETKVEPVDETKVEPVVETKVEPVVETKVEPVVETKVETKVEPVVKPSKKATKAKKSAKADTKVEPTKTNKKPYSTYVDKYIESAHITDPDVIEALRSQEVADCYRGKQHCYVTMACRCKLLDLFRKTDDYKCWIWAMHNSNAATIKSLRNINFFNVADVVNSVKDKQ